MLNKKLFHCRHRENALEREKSASRRSRYACFYAANTILGMRLFYLLVTEGVSKDLSKMVYSGDLTLVAIFFLLWFAYIRMQSLIVSKVVSLYFGSLATLRSYGTEKCTLCSIEQT